jgi:hypothetical protein
VSSLNQFILSLRASGLGSQFLDEDQTRRLDKSLQESSTHALLQLDLPLAESIAKALVNDQVGKALLLNDKDRRRLSSILDELQPSLGPGWQTRWANPLADKGSLRLKPDSSFMTRRARKNSPSKPPKEEPVTLPELPTIRFLKERSSTNSNGVPEVFGEVLHTKLKDLNDVPVIEGEFQSAHQQENRERALKLALILAHVHSQVMLQAMDDQNPATEEKNLGTAYLSLIRRIALLEWVKTNGQSDIIIDTPERTRLIRENLDACIHSELMCFALMKALVPPQVQLVLREQARPLIQIPNFIESPQISVSSSTPETLEIIHSEEGTSLLDSESDARIQDLLGDDFNNLSEEQQLRIREMVEAGASDEEILAILQEPHSPQSFARLGYNSKVLSTGVSSLFKAR